jgi:hypothetical protein
LIETVLRELDDEIARLTKVRQLLAGGAPVPVHRGPGRPPKSSPASASVKPSVSAAAAKKRTMSDEARRAIGDAQRKRWAKSKRAAAKAARAAALSAPFISAKKAAKKSAAKKAAPAKSAKKLPGKRKPPTLTLKRSAAASAKNSTSPTKKTAANKAAKKTPAKRGRPAKSLAPAPSSTAELSTPQPSALAAE